MTPLSLFKLDECAGVVGRMGLDVWLDGLMWLAILQDLVMWLRGIQVLLMSM